MLTLKKKILFTKLEITYKISFFLLIRYKTFVSKIKIIFKKNRLLLKKLLLRQFCIISTRTRSSYILCSLSRFKIKEFISKGFIPNLKKLSW